MSAVSRDKAWARRFARTGGDLGIRHVGPRIKLPIAIWKPQPAIPKRRVTVPSPQSRAATPDPLPADVDCTSARLVARRQVTEYAADECASACSPDYWAEAPASYEEIRG